MPRNYLRRLAGRERTAAANRQLAFFLAFVAGAANAGGFLAVRQYTSHMSGVMAAMADNSAQGAFRLVAEGSGALLSFMMGAALTAVLVNFARRRKLESEYAGPLLLEAALLVIFGVTGREFNTNAAAPWAIPATVGLLCFTMGLQNAIISKLSHAEIRTTHITGMVTDIGVELGKLFYRNGVPPFTGARPVVADRAKLGMLSTLVGLFFTGGVAGALGFKHAGFLFTIPLAAVLVVLAAVPVIDDLRQRR